MSRGEGVGPARAREQPRRKMAGRALSVERYPRRPEAGLRAPRDPPACRRCRSSRPGSPSVASTVRSRAVQRSGQRLEQRRRTPLPAREQGVARSRARRRRSTHRAARRAADCRRPARLPRRRALPRRATPAAVPPSRRACPTRRRAPARPRPTPARCAGRAEGPSPSSASRDGAQPGKPPRGARVVRDDDLAIGRTAQRRQRAIGDPDAARRAPAPSACRGTAARRRRRAARRRTAAASSARSDAEAAVLGGEVELRRERPLDDEALDAATRALLEEASAPVAHHQIVAERRRS